MFGYDDKKLERIRSSRPVSRLIVALELLVLVLGLAVLGIGHIFTTQAGLQQVVNRIVGDAPVTVTVGDVTLLPSSRLLDPDSWRLLVSDLSVRPDSADQTRIDVARVVIGMPGVMRAWATRELFFDQVRVIGLEIQAPRQRPPEPWEATRTALKLVEIGHLEIWDAHYAAAPDAPLLEADVDLIWGDLYDLRYELGNRELTGHGALRAERFQTGSLVLSHLHIDAIAADRSNIEFRDATFRYAEGTGAITGQALDVHRRAAIHLEVSLRGARAERMVETSTGRRSPIFGRVDTTLFVHSGGDLPRGGAWMEGVVALSDGFIPLGAEVTNLQRDLLQLAPFIQLDDQDRVVLGAATGRMQFSRGTVTVHELLYAAPNRQLQLWGQMGGDDLQLTLRLVPLRDPATRPGVGLVLTGSAEDLRLRLARREELLRSGGPEVGADPAEGAPDADAPAKRFSLPFGRGISLRRKNSGDDGDAAPPPEEATP